jgi:hypothetical protein
MDSAQFPWRPLGALLVEKGLLTGPSSSRLWPHGNFLEAADFAAEVVERRSLEALEIRKGDGDTTETVWTYSESAARAAVESQEKLVNTFGFDVTRWGKARGSS